MEAGFEKSNPAFFIQLISYMFGLNYSDLRLALRVETGAVKERVRFFTLDTLPHGRVSAPH
jgi:hypothetical protein